MLITSTQASLAQLAGSSRESASRFLAVLERAGIITQGRGKLVVHDPACIGALRLLGLSGEWLIPSFQQGAWSCEATRSS